MAREKARGTLDSGAALKKFREMCAAQGAKKVIVGQNALLSTPAASHLIRLNHKLPPDQILGNKGNQIGNNYG